MAFIALMRVAASDVVRHSVPPPCVLRAGCVFLSLVTPVWNGYF